MMFAAWTSGQEADNVSCLKLESLSSCPHSMESNLADSLDIAGSAGVSRQAKLGPNLLCREPEIKPVDPKFEGVATLETCLHLCTYNFKIINMKQIEF